MKYTVRNIAIFLQMVLVISARTRFVLLAAATHFCNHHAFSEVDVHWTAFPQPPHDGEGDPVSPR
jgi:hypothetical protein